MMSMMIKVIVIDVTKEIPKAMPRFALPATITDELILLIKE